MHPLLRVSPTLGAVSRDMRYPTNFPLLTAYFRWALTPSSSKPKVQVRFHGRGLHPLQCLRVLIHTGVFLVRPGRESFGLQSSPRSLEPCRALLDDRRTRALATLLDLH